MRELKSQGICCRRWGSQDVEGFGIIWFLRLSGFYDLVPQDRTFKLFGFLEFSSSLNV